MLSACLHATDAARSWAPTQVGWDTGLSTIRPYAHPALHAGMFVSKRRTAVIVRERIGGQPRQDGSSSITKCSERALDEVLAQSRAWPLDFIELLITRHDGLADVRLRCGHWGTAPVYLLIRDGVFHLSWDVTHLYQFLPSTNLDPAFAAQYVFGLDHPYSRQTIFPGIWMLTERATALISSPFRSIKITYPRHEERARAKRLKRNAHVVETFREILTTSMQRWLTSKDDLLAVELSGGLDSSIVAAAAANITTRPVRSYGMIMPGAFGKYQRARRNEVVRNFGLFDSTFPCIQHPPFNPKSRRASCLAVVPWGEFYEEAVGTLLGRAASDGASLIFTGMGGDELCSHQLDESYELSNGSDEENLPNGLAVEEVVPLDDDGINDLPFATETLRNAYEERDGLIDDAPQPLMETSSLESAAAVSNLYLNHGIWPVSPLCTPELVQFCRKLPAAWRHERIIERKVLTSFGCSSLVAYPKPESLENFDPVMDFAMREASSSVINRLFRDSRLAEQGLVDRDRLIATYKQYRRGDRRYGLQLLGAAVLELTVRSLERHQS